MKDIPLFGREFVIQMKDIPLFGREFVIQMKDIPIFGTEFGAHNLVKDILIAPLVSLNSSYKYLGKNVIS